MNFNKYNVKAISWTVIIPHLFSPLTCFGIYRPFSRNIRLLIKAWLKQNTISQLSSHKHFLNFITREMLQNVYTRVNNRLEWIYQTWYNWKYQVPVQQSGSFQFIIFATLATLFASSKQNCSELDYSVTMFYRDSKTKTMWKNITLTLNAHKTFPGS